LTQNCGSRETDWFLVAELVSAYPTAGGMYFVTKHVVPKEHVAVWAWIIGWCNFLGQAAGVASLAYTIAQMILATVVMNSTIVDGSTQFKPSVCPLSLTDLGYYALLTKVLQLKLPTSPHFHSGPMPFWLHMLFDN
jgi:amino acid transporter